jgi:outer membrane protein assembly factor BamB
MKLFKVLISIVILNILFFGCGRKFKYPRNAEFPESIWSYPRKNINSIASIESDFKGYLNLKWETEAPDQSIGPLTIGAGNLILPGKNGRICFFDMKSGKYNGRYFLKKGIQTGVVVEDSLVYYGVSHKRNKIHCRNIFNGKILWHKSVKDVTGTPIIIDKHIYMISALGEVFCMDKMTGKIVWRDSLGQKSTAGPSSDGKSVLIPFDDGVIRSYDATSGEINFEVELGEPLMSHAVIAGDVYLTGAGGSVYALDLETGEILWQKNYKHSIWTAPALDDGILYYGDNVGNLIALRERDGQIMWTFKTGGVILSSPIVVGNFVIFASLDKNLYSLNKKKGHLISKIEFKSGIEFPPVSNGDNIFVTSRDGGLFCFGN